MEGKKGGGRGYEEEKKNETTKGRNDDCCGREDVDEWIKIRDGVEVGVLSVICDVWRKGGREEKDGRVKEEKGREGNFAAVKKQNAGKERVKICREKRSIHSYLFALVTHPVQSSLRQFLKVRVGAIWSQRAGCKEVVICWH